MKKRIIAFLLVVIMTISCTGMAFAAGDGSGKVTLERLTNDTLRAGDSFSVVVKLTENPGMASLKLRISYSEKLTLTEASGDQEIFETEDFGEDVSKNPYTLLYTSKKNTDVTGTLATLTFKISENATENDVNTITCSVAEAYLNDSETKVSVDGSELNVTVAASSTIDEETGKVTLERLSNDTLRAGDSFGVAVKLTENPGMASLKVRISYSEKLILTDASGDQDIFETEDFGEDVSENPYVLLYTNNNNTTETGTLATLTFKISDSATENDVNTITCYVVEAYLNDSETRVSVDGSELTVAVSALPTIDDDDVAIGDADAEVVEGAYTYTYDGEGHAPAVVEAPVGAEVAYKYERVVINEDETVEKVELPEGQVPTDAGSYVVTATVSKAGYQDKVLTADIVITPKELTVSGLTAADKTYDGNTDATVSGGALVGVVEGDEVEATFPTEGEFEQSSVGANLAVSTAAVTISGDDAANYTLTQPETLRASINAAPITVTADNKTKVQGAADPALTYTASRELVEGDEFTGALSREAGEAPGEYAIIQGTLSLSDNYALTFVPGVLTITTAQVTNLEITTPPTKTAYIEGETFDPAGMVVTATYDNGETEEVTGYTYNTEPLTVGDKEVVISFGGKTATVAITVSEKQLVSIAVNAENAKTEFVVGEQFTSEGIVVTATYDNGSSEPVTGYTVDEPDMDEAGEKTVTVTYKEKEATYTINVVGKKVTAIELDTSNVTTSYYVDDEFSAEGLVVTAVYNDGSRRVVTDYEVSSPDMTTSGTKYVGVLYTENGISVYNEFVIRVSLKASDLPSVTTYTITVIAGKNGTVYGSTTVVAGCDATFRFVPDDGYQVEDVLVNGKSVGAVSSYTFQDVHADATLTVTFVKSTSLPFVDVAKSAWYYDDVCFVYANGLMNGVSATRFAPTADFSRAMIAQVLYNLEGRPAVTASKTFSDVSASDWYADAVAWVTENGIFLGYGDGTFAPNTSISREQMATVLYRYVAFKGYNVNASANLARFTDAAKVSNWAKDGVIWAVDNGILGGYTDGSLRPLGTATRAEVAKMLTVFMENVIG